MPPDPKPSCPICSSAEATGETENDVTLWSCPVCGKFKTPAGHTGPLVPRDRAHQLSAYVRRQNLHKRGAPLMLPAGSERQAGGCLPDDVSQWFPDRVADRLDRALLNLRQMSPHPGEAVELAEDDYPVLLAENRDAMYFLLEQLERAGLVEECPELPKVRLTAAGWNRCAEIEHRGGGPDAKQAFVAMPFHPKVIAGRKLAHALAKGVREAGHRPFLALGFGTDGIPDVILAEIRRSRFLVADLTEKRPNVYFEAGFALGLGMPVIWTCNAEQLDQGDVPFDVSEYRVIPWEAGELGALSEQLCNRIRAVIV